MMRRALRGRFGIDAPWVPWLLTALALCSVLALLAFRFRGSGPTAVVNERIFGAYAVFFGIAAALYWHASLRGKFAVWDELLASQSPSEVTDVLDVGCGHAAVAIMVARRCPAAEVAGIDLWRGVDQSGNSPQAARSNAGLNGVAERVRFVTGDMTRLPFADGRFDLVTASFSIHNVRSAEGRAEAVREAVRVLAPTGRIVIVDIRRGREYATELRRLGLTVEGPRGLGWRLWWGGPWMSSAVVVAARQGASQDGSLRR